MLLITPQEVLASAFMPREVIDPDSIRPLKIDIVQEQYIRPRLGDELYDELTVGEHTEFLSLYIKPALAHYVRSAIIDELSIQLSDNGAIIYLDGTQEKQCSDNTESASTVEEQDTLDSSSSTKSGLVGTTQSANQQDSEQSTAITSSASGGISSTPTEEEIKNSSSTSSSDSTSNETTSSTDKTTTTTNQNNNTLLDKKQESTQSLDRQRRQAATAEQRKMLVIGALSDANILMGKAIRYLEKHIEEFPTYEPRNPCRRLFF